ncbi:MAG: prohibitin family protein [Thermoplasmata archaeon]
MAKKIKKSRPESTGGNGPSAIPGEQADRGVPPETGNEKDDEINDIKNEKDIEPVYAYLLSNPGLLKDQQLRRDFLSSVQPGDEESLKKWIAERTERGEPVLFPEDSVRASNNSLKSNNVKSDVEASRKTEKYNIIEDQAIKKIETRNELEKEGYDGGKKVVSNKGVAIGAAVAVIGIIAIVILSSSWEIVEAGYKGVIISSPSGPSTEEINEGWNFNPYYLMCKIEQIRYNTQVLDMSYSTLGTVTVRSRDNLNIEMDLSVVYSLEPDKVAEIRINYGNIQDVIARYARSVPRDVASMYNATYMGGEGRAEVGQAITEKLTANLSLYYVKVEDVLIRSIDLPDEVDRAIEEKKKAEQNIITQQYNLMAQEYVANQTIVNAKARADALIINATAQAHALEIEANARANATRIIMASLNSTPENQTADYLRYMYIQALTDPNSRVQFVVIPSNSSVPILISPMDNS